MTSHLPQSSNTCHCSSLSLALLLQFILIEGQNFFQQTSHPFSRVGVSTRVALHHIFLLVMAKQNILMASFGRLLLCLMKDCHLPGSLWPSVFSEALHCICSLISTAMDTSPHDLFLHFEQNFRPLPSTVTLHTGNYAWLHQHVRNKNDSSGDLVKVVATYPGYAMISRDGTTTDTVNWRHLAPHPGPTEVTQSTLDTTDAAHLPSPVTNLPSAQQFRNTSEDSVPSVATPPPAASASPSTLTQTAESPSQLHYQTLHGCTIKPPVCFGYGENVV